MVHVAICRRSSNRAVTIGRAASAFKRGNHHMQSPTESHPRPNGGTTERRCGKDEACYGTRHHDLKSAKAFAEVLVRSRLIHAGEMTVAHCHVKDESVTIYEDGSYRDVAPVESLSTVFGDTFEMDVYLKVGGVSGTTVAHWHWHAGLNPGDSTTVDVSGSDAGIKNNFDTIDWVTRELTCNG